MSVFDCSDEISKFHKERVTLRDTDRKDMRERRDNGRTRLRTGLIRDNNPLPKMIHSQGSYQMRTMIQDEDCDYDIDDGVYFRYEDLQNDDGGSLTPLQARERVCSALAYDLRFAKNAEVHHNCVRQEYRTGYHIDVPVYRIELNEEDDKEIYKLASSDEWQLSDARAVTSWFKDKVKELNDNGDGEDGKQMRRVVRLSKAQARCYKDRKEKTTSGITITKLVVDNFEPCAGRDDEALIKVWKKIYHQLFFSTQVNHPVNAVNLADEGNNKVGFFRERLAEALSILEVVEGNCTRNEAREAWDEVFNTDFFSKLPDPKNGNTESGSWFAVTESKTDKRDDGNGRYGMEIIV